MPTDTEHVHCRTAGLSLSAVARELGMSGPALYRYFASRDALLLELVIDAYSDLAETLEIAVAERQAEVPPLRRLLDAYRSWASAHPHRYRLLYQPPVPGFDPNEGSLVSAAQRSMTILIGVLSPVRESATGDRGESPLTARFTSWAEGLGLEVSPSTVLCATLIWRSNAQDLWISSSGRRVRGVPSRVSDRQVTE